MNKEEFNEKMVKLNEIMGILKIDERFKWYFVGLVEGYKIGRGWK